MVQHMMLYQLLTKIIPKQTEPGNLAVEAGNFSRETGKIAPLCPLSGN